jgi:hypothetical protein
MLDVVVLPWVPATAIVRRTRVSSPSSSARLQLALAALAGDRTLRVVGRDGRRDDDLRGHRDVLGRVARRRLDPRGAQARLVRAPARAV